MTIYQRAKHLCQLGKIRVFTHDDLQQIGKSFVNHYYQNIKGVNDRVQKTEEQQPYGTFTVLSYQRKHIPEIDAFIVSKLALKKRKRIPKPIHSTNG